MSTQARLITLQAITFLHPGTGQSTGVVDLPIQREVHTGYPMFASSGFKGSLRDKAEQEWGKDHADIQTLFGSSAGIETPNAGSFSVTDARILAFPGRSLQQLFVWVTCPMVIERLVRDIGLINLPFDGLPITLTPPAAETATVSTESDVTGTLILEEVNFTVDKNSQVNELAKLITGLLDANAGFDGKRLAIIPNADFQHLVRYATQVSARIKLNDRKTTDGDGGNLWYEETLPPETIMYALALCHAPRQDKDKSPANPAIPDAEAVAAKLDTLLANRFLQIGGNETVGQGWCCVKANGAKP